MAIDGRTLPEKFFPGTGRSYDRVVAWTTLGFDGRWKRRLVRRLPECSSILELASGTGILTAMLLERFPKARVTGVDMTADYMEVARERLASAFPEASRRFGPDPVVASATCVARGSWS